MYKERIKSKEGIKVMKKNNKKVNNTNIAIDNNDKIKILLVAFILIFLIGLIVFARNFRNFTNVSLRTNNKDIFNIKDLTFGDIKYLDKEEKVEKILGKPKKKETKFKDRYFYKILKYDDTIITLKEDYKDYVVVGIETTSKKYKTARNIKVGNRITKVLKNYRVDNKKGTYMYGNNSLSALSDESVTKDIYMGYRTTEEVSYINRDTIVDKTTPTMLSKITYEYKYGKVTKISWIYDVE